MSRDLIESVLWLLLFAVLAVVVLVWPLTRSRMERLALREGLHVTSGTATFVATYLATTRRWRVGGVVAATVALLEWALLSNQGLNANLSFAFAAWFAGAVVAEYRLASPPAAGRRVAALHRRELRDYLNRFEILVPAVVWGAGAAGGVAVLLLHPAARGAVGLLLLVMAVVGGFFWLVVYRVLHRPQPLSAAEILATDNALRRRSLHVLAGSALAIGGYAAALIAVTANVNAASPDRHAALVLCAQVFGQGFLPIVGVIIALGPRVSRTSAEPSAASVTSLG